MREYLIPMFESTEKKALRKKYRSMSRSPRTERPNTEMQIVTPLPEPSLSARGPSEVRDIKKDTLMISPRVSPRKPTIKEELMLSDQLMNKLTDA